MAKILGTPRAREILRVFFAQAEEAAKKRIPADKMKYRLTFEEALDFLQLQSEARDAEVGRGTQFLDKGEMLREMGKPVFHGTGEPTKQEVVKEYFERRGHNRAHFTNWAFVRDAVRDGWAIDPVACWALTAEGLAFLRDTEYWSLRDAARVLLDNTPGDVHREASAAILYGKLPTKRFADRHTGMPELHVSRGDFLRWATDNGLEVPGAFVKFVGSVPPRVGTGKGVRNACSVLDEIGVTKLGELRIGFATDRLVFLNKTTGKRRTAKWGDLSLAKPEGRVPVLLGKLAMSGGTVQSANTDVHRKTVEKANRKVQDFLGSDWKFFECVGGGMTRCLCDIELVAETERRGMEYRLRDSDGATDPDWNNDPEL